MFLESKLEAWVAGMRAKAVLPLRLKLWNGREYDFGMGDATAPAVTVSVPQASSLPYLLRPSLFNLGRAYVEGHIDVDGEVDQIIRVADALAANTGQDDGIRAPMASTLHEHAGRALDKVAPGLRHGRKADAAAIHYHYDVSNDFYALWLDPQMVYSCAYFEHGDETLATAQRKKIDHILTKLHLQPGHVLLDIGCGWGALVLRAAEKFGARCVGVTLSENQYRLARERVATAGLERQVEIQLADYRDLRGSYDRITSVGMFEHVGLRNLRSYFAKIRSLLTTDGFALNHGITTTDTGHHAAAHGAGEFIERYVFPHGELAHVGAVLRWMQEGGLEVVDVENLRRHYARTCRAWSDNFDRNAVQIRQLVDEKRYRIWRVYLAGCAYAFERDWIALYQVLCTRSGSDARLVPWSRRYMYARPL